MFRCVFVYVFSLFVFCFLSFGFAQDSLDIDQYILAIENKQQWLSSAQKLDFQKKTFAALSLQAIQSRTNQDHFLILSSLQKYLFSQISSTFLVPSGLPDLVSYVDSGARETLLIPRVDEQQVRLAWLQWHNQERATLWKQDLEYHPILEHSSLLWARYLGSIQRTTHRRSTSDSYYDYFAIKHWFEDKGVRFASQETSGQSLFTENLWWNVYNCKKEDCTTDFIAAMKKTRLFFLSEKGKSYRPHYNAIVGNYTHIWLGLAFVGNKYYLVSHYTQALE